MPAYAEDIVIAKQRVATIKVGKRMVRTQDPKPHWMDRPEIGRPRREERIETCIRLAERRDGERRPAVGGTRSL
ncbi:MAG: hypothetical protein Rhob2KO_12540 [Rhodopirellula baltica]